MEGEQESDRDEGCSLKSLTLWDETALRWKNEKGRVTKGDDLQNVHLLEYLNCTGVHMKCTADSL